MAFGERFDENMVVNGFRFHEAWHISTHFTGFLVAHVAELSLLFPAMKSPAYKIINTEQTIKPKITPELRKHPSAHSRHRKGRVLQRPILITPAATSF